MQIQVDKKKWLKNAGVLLAELILIIAGLILVGTAGARGFDNLKVYTTVFPEKQNLENIMASANGLIPDGEGYITGDDSFFVIPVNADKLLDIEMDQLEQNITGFIWQSETEEFNNEPGTYTFELGHNPIQMQKTTKYIKVLISDVPGLHYNIKNISYRNPFEIYARIHKKEIIKIAFAFLLLIIAAKAAEHIPQDRKKLKKAASLTLFLVVTGATAGYIFYQYIFGDRLFIFADIGSDTIQQYYPYYMNCVRRIQEGTFGIWNWDYGLGTSLMNNISQTLDPFGLFVILGGVVFGISKVRRLLVIAQILKIVLSALLCRYFLKMFRLSEKAACVGGYLYAFNGYLMLWGQHYLLGTICVYQIIILIFLEKLLREIKTRYVAGLGLSVAASVLYSYYNTYMALAFAAIYCVLRMLDSELNMRWKGRIQHAVAAFGTMVCGVLMGAVTLLPAASYLTSSSSRLDSSESAVVKFLHGLFSAYPMDANIETTGRLISNNVICINQTGNATGWGNYYEMPNVCLTVFVFIFLGQFLIRKIKACKNIKQALYGILVAVVAVFILYNPGFAIAFNGFAYAQARYTFVIMPMAALLVASEWESMIVKKEISIWGLLLGLGMSIAVLLQAGKRASTEVIGYDGELIVLCIIFALLLLTGYLCRTRQIFGMIEFLIAVCLIVSVGKENYITNNERVTAYASRENIGYSGKEIANDTTEALKYIKERDDSFYRVEKTYSFYSTYGDPLIAGYSAITDYNSTINRNLSMFYTNLYSSQKVTDAQRAFIYTDETERYPMKLIDLKYILSASEIDFPGFQYMDKIGNVYIYQNMNADSVASFYEKTMTQEACEQLDEGSRRRLLNDTLIIEDGQEGLQEQETGQVEIGTFRTEGAALKGTVSNEKEGYLLLVIPDQDGWEIYVDGQKTETINGDYGFPAVRLAAGNHEIYAKYHIPRLKEGIVGSIIGIVMLVMVCLYLNLKSKKEVFLNRDEGKN